MTLGSRLCVVVDTIGVLLLALFLNAPGAGQAASPELVVWDQLAPSVEPYEDPFLDMSIDQKSDLRDILLARQAVEAGSTDAGLQARALEARAQLETAGFDPDFLLVQRLVVMERRREEATGVTSSHLDSEVLMDGYVLPLSWEGERVVEFLLVPWVGACIHTPPPQPNQIIHVSFPEGITLQKRFEAVRLKGTLRHEPLTHELFLMDGSRKIPASYQLNQATISGTPGEIIAASALDRDLSMFSRVQIWINNLFTSGMMAISNGGSIKAIVVALLISFGYGALHTLGPGHGKAVVISYFVGTGGSLMRGLKMGIQIAVFHVLSAVIVVFLFDLAIRQTTGEAPSDYRTIRLFSYGLIIIIGLVMLWQALRAVQAVRVTRDAEANARHDSGHDSHAHHGHEYAHPGCVACAAASTQRGGGWMAAAVGAVPCTGALLVMLFGLANDLVLPAIFMVVAISAGMAVAMSGIGIAALWGRNWAENRFASSGNGRVRFELGSRVAGATCVLVIGVLLFGLSYSHQTIGASLSSELALQNEADTAPEG